MKCARILTLTTLLAMVSACGDNSSEPTTFVEAQGNLDNSFMQALGTGPSSSVDAMIILNDGGILIGGRFESVSSNSQSYLFKLNSSGAPDTAFNSNMGSGPNNSVYALMQASDGSIYVGGDFTSFNGTNFGRLAKLSSTGVVDYSFSSFGTGFNGKVSTIASYDSETILVGGSFSTYRGTSVGKIAKLSSTGALNSVFDSNSGSGFNLEVNTIHVSGTSIFVGGSFESYKGSSARRLAKLNSEGELDSAFHSNFGTTGFNAGVLTIFPYDESSLIIGGQYTTFDSESYGRITGLSSLGSLSEILNDGFSDGFTNAVHSVADQPNGSILIGGAFSSYKSADAPGLVRLNSNLSLDRTFLTNIGDGFDGTVRVVKVQSDGKILVAGDFNSFDSNDSPYLVRLE